jgi:hypothetical protein
VTIPINHQGDFEVYTGAPTMLVEEYKRLGSVFTVKVLTDSVSFLFSPGVSSHFFEAEETDMSQKEVNTKYHLAFGFPPSSTVRQFLSFYLTSR